VLALLTGALLIYPKHYSFHTPWVQMAFIIVSIFILGIIVLFFYKKMDHAFFYSILLVLLILISQDAIRKITFF